MKVRRLLNEEVLRDGITVCERQLPFDYPLHWHEFYEIEYVLEGEAEFVINDKRYKATKNSFFFLTPVDFQSIKITKAPLRVINVMFDGGLIETELGGIINAPAAVSDYPQQKLDMLFGEYKRRQSLWKFSCRQILNLILADVCRVSGNAGEAAHFDFIRNEQIYLQKHFFENITLNDAAARAGFSPNYFSRLFHKETGKTFNAYLTDLRISHAALLAEHTSKNVSDICEQCGFKNPAHFMRLFKKAHNMTVLKYRKMVREERKEKIMWNSKAKALTFSFDDGINQDKRLIELFNKYGVKATFNINSGLAVGSKGTLERRGATVDFSRMHLSNVPETYKGHEVAAHGIMHYHLRQLDDEALIHEVEEDRKTLSALVGYNVQGMAYPFSVSASCDDRVKDILRSKTGIKFARTTDSTYSFELQNDLLQFNPTAHILEWEELFRLAEEFVAYSGNERKLFYIWGHGFDLDTADDNWGKLESLLKILSGREDTFYGTNSEVLL